MLKGKKILIGISGGIGVYKVCGLINKLKKSGVVTKVIMTDAATRFVTPLTFQTLSNNHVYTDIFSQYDDSIVEHINLADWCDLMLLIPATANTIAKVANGICDNMLTTVVSALPPDTRVLIVPAMNCHMWENPITQLNINKLETLRVNKKKKYFLAQPIEGDLACGYNGIGKVADNETIITSIQSAIG